MKILNTKKFQLEINIPKTYSKGYNANIFIYPSLVFHINHFSCQTWYTLSLGWLFRGISLRLTRFIDCDDVQVESEGYGDE